MNDTPQIIASKIDGLHHQFTVALDGQEVEQLVGQRLQELQKTVLIKGFRRGKAPLKVVRNYHGKKVGNSIVDRLAIDVARDLIAGQALRPLGRPIIDIINADETDAGQVRFTLTLEVFPHVELRPVDGLKLERLVLVADEQRASRELHELSRLHVKRQILDRLMEQYEFAVPTEMVKREYQRITGTYRETVEDYVQPELNMQFQQLAERRIRLAILLTEMGRQYSIHIPRHEVEKLVEAQAERDPEHAADIVNYYLDHPSAITELQSTLFEERVIDYIVARSAIRDRQVTADELLAVCNAE